MNVEQARKNFETATVIRKEAEQKLEDHYNLVNGANEAEKAAESIFLDILANEPTEDKVIDMSHFIGSNLIMSFHNNAPDGCLHYLQNILDSGEYRTNNGFLFENCEPMFNYDYASMTGWSKPPIPEGYVIEVFFYSDVIKSYHDYSGVIWKNVRIFRITGIRDKFKHGWQRG